MKKILTIVLILFTLNVFAQEPILGTWHFALNKKIDYPVMMDSAKAFGYDTSTSEARLLLFISVGIILTTRCDNSEITFSSFENQVMLRTKRLNNKSIEDTQWGKWSKINNKQYLIRFKNRKELYELNELTGEFHLVVSDNNSKLITKLLSNNLKLIKKGD
jgi:hypothetical protein